MQQPWRGNSAVGSWNGFQDDRYKRHILGLERFALWPEAALLMSSAVFCIVRAARNQLMYLAREFSMSRIVSRCTTGTALQFYCTFSGTDPWFGAGRNLMTPTLTSCLYGIWTPSLVNSWGCCQLGLKSIHTRFRW